MKHSPHSIPSPLVGSIAPAQTLKFQPDDSPISAAGLVGAETCLRLIFPDEATRPCLRFFRDLQAKRLVPFRQIGRRIFFDPREVRAALDRQFSVRTRP
jgi:hypothetical protein